MEFDNVIDENQSCNTCVSVKVCSYYRHIEKVAHLAKEIDIEEETEFEVVESLTLAGTEARRECRSNLGEILGKYCRHFKSSVKM